MLISNRPFKQMEAFVELYCSEMAAGSEAAELATAEFEALEKLIDEREQFLRENNPRAATIFKMLWKRAAILNAKEFFI